MSLWLHSDATICTQVCCCKKCIWHPLPFLQLCPVQPEGQVHRPVTASQRALFSQIHFIWHPWPKRPLGHADSRGGAKKHLSFQINCICAVFHRTVYLSSFFFFCEWKCCSYSQFWQTRPMNPGGQIHDPLCLSHTPPFSQSGQVSVQPRPQNPSGHTGKQNDITHFHQQNIKFKKIVEFLNSLF